MNLEDELAGIIEARRIVLQDTAERAAALADLLDSVSRRWIYSLRTGERLDAVGMLRAIAAKAEIDLALLPDPSV